MAAQSIQKARDTTAPSLPSPGDRALLAIAGELRRIGDALARTANHLAAQEPAEPESDPATPATPEEEQRFQSLREWRANEARRLGMPPYIVATDKALRALAQKRPASVEDLRGIPGFGPAKAAKYGAGVIEVLAAA